MGSLILPIVMLVIMGIAVVAFFYITKKDKKDNKDNKKDGNNKKQEDFKQEDIFNFLEFDKIMDDMIVQKNGKKYSMVIKCKGINYDLMSEIEQLSVEEGFTTFLNTLKFPIQLYVQAQNIDLKNTVSIYKKNLEDLQIEYNDALNKYNNLINSLDKYNNLINSLDSNQKQINDAENNLRNIQNVVEYSNDIVRYVEKLSLNKSLLQRSFYVILSYHTSEITDASNFSKAEIESICYNELYTRALSVVGGLSSSSVKGEILKSNDLAELLYISYNRDDKNYLDIKQALDSGYYRLYSTAPDVFDKKNKMIEEEYKRQSQIKAYEAIKKAIKEGRIKPEEVEEDEQNQAITKEALMVVKNEDIDNDIKTIAKEIIMDDYKSQKRELQDKLEKKRQQQINNTTNNNDNDLSHNENNIIAVSENTAQEQNSNIEKNENVENSIIENSHIDLDKEIIIKDDLINKDSSNVAQVEKNLKVHEELLNNIQDEKKDINELVDTNIINNIHNSTNIRDRISSRGSFQGNISNEIIPNTNENQVNEIKNSENNENSKTSNLDENVNSDEIKNDNKQNELINNILELDKKVDSSKDNIDNDNSSDLDSKKKKIIDTANDSIV